MEELLDQLGLNFKLVFIQLVGFILLYWLLKKFLFGRVMEMIQKRGDEIKGAYEENEKIRDEASVLKAEYEKKLQDAKIEAESILHRATEKAEKAGQEIIEKTRLEAGLIRDRGLAEIEQEKRKVISEIRNDVVNISVEIASRIIEKTIKPDEAAKLTDEVIKKIGGMTL
jgi:F-type H+-transporting ATPase subunit b